MNDINGFLDYLAHKDLRLIEQAELVAYWLDRTQVDDGRETIGARLVAKFLNDNKVRSRPNTTRLQSDLKVRSGIIIEKNGAITIMRVRAKELHGQIEQFLEPPAPVISEHVIAINEVETLQRIYINETAKQINGCYQIGAYDACAVMLRRLFETLLIEAFERANKINLIEDANNKLIGFDAMIKLYVGHEQPLGKPNQHSKNDFPQIKDFGDTSAHNRRARATKAQIDELKPRIHRLMQELVTIT